MNLGLTLSEQLVHSFAAAAIGSFAFFFLAYKHVQDHITKDEDEKGYDDKSYDSIENHDFPSIIAALLDNTHSFVVTSTASNINRFIWKFIQFIIDSNLSFLALFGLIF